MKIRIEANTLRLRLKKSELALFAAEESVSQLISFGKKSLVYRLKMTNEEEVLAQFEENIISVLIPKELARNWIATDLVSIENKDSEPQILVEKDFKCTTDACIESQKDQSDFFENPKEKC